MNALMKHLESTSVIDPVKLSNGMMITFQSDDDADVVLDYARYTRLITTNNRYFTGDEIFDDSWDEKRAEIEANGGYVFPLYMIAHSGVSLSLTPFSDPWDSGQVGFAYVQGDYVSGNTEEEREKNAREYAESDVGMFNDYLSGSIYVATLYDPNGELLESVGGMWGETARDDALAYFRDDFDYIPDSVTRI